MTSDEQEALSHQHFGLWLVPLESGGVALFDHPNGRLLRTLTPFESDGSRLVVFLRQEMKRLDEERKQRHVPRRTAPTLDLSGIKF